MSDSEGSSPVEEDPNAIEDREADEEFHEACSRAVVCMCERDHHDMLLDKGRSKRSASSINGHLASRMSGMSWQRVRDHVLRYIGVGAPLGTHSQVRLATRKRHLATCKPHLATRKRHLATCKPHLATCKPRLTTFLLWPAAACPRPPQPHPNPPN